MTRDEAIERLQRVRTYENRRTFQEAGDTLEIIAEYLHSIGEDQVAVELERTSDRVRIVAGHHFF